MNTLTFDPAITSTSGSTVITVLSYDTTVVLPPPPSRVVEPAQTNPVTTLSFTKDDDDGFSPALALACQTGKQVGTATLISSRGDDTVTVVMSHVIVQSFTVTGTPAVDTVTLSYASAVFIYSVATKIPC